MLSRFLPVALGAALVAPAGCGPEQKNKKTNNVATSGKDTGDTAPGDTGPAESGDTAPDDADGDGFVAASDCDDGDSTVFPGAPEVCGDGVVNDCDGSEDAAAASCDSAVSTADALASWSMRVSIDEPLRVAGVGDLDGDGQDDVVLGSPWMYGSSGGGKGTGDYDAGGLYVFHGPLAGEHTTGDEDRCIVGTEEYDYVGWDLVGLGDADGDGYDDFAVGAPGHPVWGTPAAYRIDGPAEISSISEATALIENGSESDCLGSSLAAVPDRNGDSAADLLVGDQCVGEVHMLSGGSNEAQEAGTDDIATFVDSDEYSRFGHALAAGDFDADGLADIAIGAPEYSTSGTDWTGLGFVSVYNGALSGSFTKSEADTLVRATTGDSVPPSYGGDPLVVLGNSVAAGDLDGDGYDDLVTGAPMRNDGTSTENSEGGAFVFRGPLPAALGIPDADFSLTGTEDSSYVGGETTADRDLDGDGHCDLLVGSGWVEMLGGSGGFGNRGRRAWIVFGPLSAGTLLASQADIAFADDADASNGPFAVQARVAGDTDGDGRPEVLVADYGEWVGLFDVPTGGI